jgi:hypothetical protein
MIIPNAPTNRIKDDALKAMIILYRPFGGSHLRECGHNCSGQMQIAGDELGRVMLFDCQIILDCKCSKKRVFAQKYNATCPLRQSGLGSHSDRLQTHAIRLAFSAGELALDLVPLPVQFLYSPFPVRPRLDCREHHTSRHSP